MGKSGGMLQLDLLSFWTTAVKSCWFQRQFGGEGGQLPDFVINMMKNMVEDERNLER